MSRTQPSDLRTRVHLDDEDAGTQTCYQNRSDVGRVMFQTPYSEFTHYDAMTDRMNPVGRNGFRMPGPCLHERITASGSLDSYFTQPELVGDRVLEASYEIPHPLIPLTKGDVRSRFQSLFGWEFANHSQEFRIDTWNKWLTQIPEDVSLANFAYELTDFDYLIKNFRSQRKIQKDLSRDWRKDQRTIHPKDMPSMANSTFLSYNFGWAPFIGDLQKLANLYDSVSKRVDFLRKNRGKPVRLYRRKRYNIDNPVVNNAFVGENKGGGNGQYRACDADLAYAEYTASCTLIQNIPGLDDEFGRLKAVLAATGFNNPAKIIWNAIPFSFMVDWMVPMQGLLQRWCTINPFVGQWDIFDVSFSVKYVVNGYDLYWGWTQNSSNTETFRKRRSIYYELYDRKLGMPLTEEEVAFSGLSQHQQRLFTSLLAGNTLFKPRK